LIKQRPQFFGSYNVLLGLAIQQKDYENAIRFGEKALVLKPDNFNVHNIMGLAYFQSKQDEAAARHFELALKFAPEDQTDSKDARVQVHNQLGLVRSRQKKYDLAIVQFEETLKLDPKQPDILNAFAQALLISRDPAVKNPSRALDLARQACELTQSKHPEYLSTLAVAYATLNNLSEAVNILEKALPLAKATGDKALIARLQKQLYLIKRALAESK
jgi:tetratricopeptide (TPR) repeat protein